MRKFSFVVWGGSTSRNIPNMNEKEDGTFLACTRLVDPPQTTNQFQQSKYSQYEKI
jgi:hypothetical protein